MCASCSLKSWTCCMQTLYYNKLSRAYRECNTMSAPSFYLTHAYKKVDSEDKKADDMYYRHFILTSDLLVMSWTVISQWISVFVTHASNTGHIDGNIRHSIDVPIRKGIYSQCYWCVRCCCSNIYIYIIYHTFMLHELKMFHHYLENWWIFQRCWLSFWQIKIYISLH